MNLTIYFTVSHCKGILKIVSSILSLTAACLLIMDLERFFVCVGVALPR